MTVIHPLFDAAFEQLERNFISPAGAVVYDEIVRLGTKAFLSSYHCKYNGRTFSVRIPPPLPHPSKSINQCEYLKIPSEGQFVFGDLKWRCQPYSAAKPVVGGLILAEKRVFFLLAFDIERATKWQARKVQLNDYSMLEGMTRQLAQGRALRHLTKVTKV